MFSVRFKQMDSDSQKWTNAKLQKETTNFEKYLFQLLGFCSFCKLQTIQTKHNSRSNKILTTVTTAAVHQWAKCGKFNCHFFDIATHAWFRQNACVSIKPTCLHQHIKTHMTIWHHINRLDKPDIARSAMTDIARNTKNFKFVQWN